MPTPLNLFGQIVFGAIGMAAFVYGRKQSAPKPVIIGVALMAYPFFIAQTWLLFLIGALLTGSLFVFRD